MSSKSKLEKILVFALMLGMISGLAFASAMLRVPVYAEDEGGGDSGGGDSDDSGDSGGGSKDSNDSGSKDDSGGDDNDKGSSSNSNDNSNDASGDNSNDNKAADKASEEQQQQKSDDLPGDVIIKSTLPTEEEQEKKENIHTINVGERMTESKSQEGKKQQQQPTKDEYEKEKAAIEDYIYDDPGKIKLYPTKGVILENKIN